MGLWTPPGGRSAVYLRIGLCLVENSTGKHLNACYNTNNQGPQFNLFSFSALGTFGSALHTSGAIFGGRFPVFFKVVYDGTNYVFTYSLDFMDSWETMATAAKATYFTTAADRIGIDVQTFATFAANEPRADIFYYSDPDF